jgi:hypothetical protein
MVETNLTEDLFPNRSWELEILNPLVGNSMLELGNKRKGDLVYKTVFESLGFRHVSVDTNGKDGSLPLDLREPLNLGTFDMVTNFGTSEHVSVTDYQGQEACWLNIVDACHAGSILISVTPNKNYPGWHNHGRWYPDERFYEELAKCNGFDVERLYSDHRLVYARLKRIEILEFRMPRDGLYRNPNRLNDWENT